MQGQAFLFSRALRRACGSWSETLDKVQVRQNTIKPLSFTGQNAGWRGERDAAMVRALLLRSGQIPGLLEACAASSPISSSSVLKVLTLSGWPSPPPPPLLTGL